MTREINWLIYLTPVFLLTIKGYTNTTVALLAIVSIFILLADQSNKLTLENKKAASIISLVLAGQFLAVFFSNLVRWQWSLPEFDAPLRLLLAIPLLLAISKTSLNYKLESVGTNLYITYMPMTLVATLVYCYFYPNAGWYAGRLSTYFVDPLYFSVICQVLAMICLANLLFSKNISLVIRLLYLILTAVGFYLAIKSQSRTGMLGVPLIILFFTYQSISHLFSKIKITIVLTIVLFCVVIFTSLEPTLHVRFLTAINDVSSYKWNALNEVDTSVGLRISFVRMAWFYFCLNPVGGWGDLGWMTEINRPEISAFATEFARNFPKAGFHNEILTNAVHFGLFGLISSICVFLVPFIFFYRYRNHANQSVKFLCIQGSSFVAMMFISSLSTEVLSLKFCASFYGFMIAVTVSSIIQLIQCEQACQKERL